MSKKRTGDTPRGRIAIRQWSLVKLLKQHSRGLTVREIAQHMDTPLRTVYRDLDVLSIVMPVYSERERGTHGTRGVVERWKLLPNEII